MLLVPDIYGPSPFYAELTRRLAGAGFAATLVDYFFREGPLVEVTREVAFARRSRFDERRALRDLHAAIDLVDRIRGPVLAMWGSADYIPPTVIDRFGKAMDAAGADYRSRIYDGAGHGFLQGLVEDRADSDIARDAWETALRFLSDTGLDGRTS